jgi:hypothetical protein
VQVRNGQTTVQKAIPSSSIEVVIVVARCGLSWRAQCKNAVTDVTVAVERQGSPGATPPTKD